MKLLHRYCGNETLEAQVVTKVSPMLGMSVMIPLVMSCMDST